MASGGDQTEKLASALANIPKLVTQIDKYDEYFVAGGVRAASD